MAALKQLFSFERTPVRLASGEVFQALKDANVRWYMVQEGSYPAAGHQVSVLYRLREGGYVVVNCSCCDLQPSAHGGSIWVSDFPPKASQVSEKEALHFLIEAHHEIPPELEPFLSEAYEGSAAHPAPAPRPMDHWVGRGLLGMLVQQPAHRVDPLKVAERVRYFAIRTVQELRAGHVYRGTDGALRFFEAALFNKYAVDPSAWWGVRNEVPPAEVSLLGVRWLPGSESIVEILQRMQQLVQAPFAALAATRLSFNDPDYPTAEEQSAAQGALLAIRTELEQRTVELGNAVDAFKSIAGTSGRSSDEDENVSARIPSTEVEAAALRPVVANLLMSIPTTWAEFDADSLTDQQSKALFLLVAAGMVERRGWVRTTIANHPTCFEWRFQATGEGGFAKVLEKTAAIEYEVWKDVWAQWRNGQSRDQSPFHAQSIKPDEWRLTSQGEIAREELSRATCGADQLTVLDFVLKSGLYGPGYWARHLLIRGPELSDRDQRILQSEILKGRDFTELSRPAVPGYGQLLEIRKLEHPATPLPVNIANWTDGATLLAQSFAQMLGQAFEKLAAEKREQQAQAPDRTEPDDQPAPTPFTGGTLVYQPDRVLLCGVDICSGKRSKTTRSALDLLRQKAANGQFIAYSAAELADNLGLKGGQNRAAGLIRDLRNRIINALSKANITSGPEDVILSGGPGYRFAECLGVQFEGEPGLEEAQSIDAPDDTDPVDPDDTNDRDTGEPDGTDQQAAKRRAWILDQLRQGHKLQTPHVCGQFGCSLATAKRDLAHLKADGSVEFVGSTRKGHYRLRRQR